MVSDGTLRCWGPDECLQNIPSDDGYVAIWAGGQKTCAQKADGTLRCWCCEWLPFEVHPDVITTCEAPTPATPFRTIEMGSFFVCGIHPDGSAECFGWPHVEQRAAMPPGPVVSVGADDVMGLFALADGTAWPFEAWGPGPGSPFDPPTDVKFVQVVQGRNHRCGLDAEGTAYCWGSTVHPNPDDTCCAPFPDPPPGRFRSLAASMYVTVGIRPDGHLEWWGGDLTEHYDVPTDDTFVQVDVGEAHACGVTTDGRAVCWGGEWYLGPNLTPPDL